MALYTARNTPYVRCTMTQQTGHIGGRVRAARELHGWSQAELAERIGVDHTRISKIENGHVENPSIRTVLELADALEVKPEWLIAEMT